MADTTTTNLGLTKPGVADPGGINAWGGKINADLDAIDAVFAPGGTGTGVGLKAAASQVWNAIAGTLKAAAARFLIVDSSDNTKVLQFDASSIATGTTRTIKAPDSNGSFVPTGVPLPFYGTTAPAGFVFAAGKTIGSASSGATERANADTQPLYTLLWALSTITVTGGKGASAAADFAANKPLVLPDHRGRALVGCDTMEGSAASVLTNYTATTPGNTGGEQSHTLTSAEQASMSVSGSTTQPALNVVTGTASFTIAAGATVASANLSLSGTATGGGGAHNNVQPFIALNIIIAL